MTPYQALTNLVIVKDFKILMDTDAFVLQNDVTDHLQKGWKLHGGLQITQALSKRRINGKVKREIVFCQSIVKL